MFGYITVDPAELKGKDFERYRAYYCGVCRDLKTAGGEKARPTLTYDMTFLAILLTALYEGEAEPKPFRCALHPLQKRTAIQNAYTAYAADMNLLLVYHNLMDDWLDDHSAPSLAAARVLRRTYLKKAAAYPRQTTAIRRYLRALHDTEAARDPSIDRAAGETGTLMAEIFVYREDVWADELRALGFYLGKFIYLMDAWDDCEKDAKSGAYNPFFTLALNPDREQEIAQILTMQAAEASRAFEHLPVLQEVDILRNILYAGIWVKYRKKRQAAAEKAQTGNPQRL